MVFGRLRSGNYQHVPQEEGEKGGEVSFREKLSLLRWRVKGVGIGFFVALFLLLGLGRSRRSHLLSNQPVNAGAQYLHVLLPVNQPDVHLCKTLISAGTLDYPVPSTITWKTPYDDNSTADGGQHIARVEGVINYLHMITSAGWERSKDVILIVDGYNTWFQLRPDVLMERYFEINRLANNRLVRKLGQTNMDDGEISQRIVFGARKQCSREADDPACYAVPESPHEERFLDSRFIMGEVASTKILFQRALEFLEADREVATAQDAFSALFGAQELQREIARATNQKTTSRVYHGLLQSLHLEHKSILSPHPTHRKNQPVANTSYEFGIGLDYEGLLSASITSSTKDADFVINNKTRSSFPEDILRSVPPFWSRNRQNTPLPDTLGWKDTSLYTNLKTSTIPATIHHSSPGSDEYSLRRTSWPKLWTQPYARTLLDGHVNEPYHAFGVLKGVGTETSWWPLHQVKWRIRNHQADRRKEWIAWEKICTQGLVADEAFRDGKGVWRAPRYEY